MLPALPAPAACPACPSSAGARRVGPPPTATTRSAKRSSAAVTRGTLSSRKRASMRFRHAS
eukprot:9375563-Alexandrium_andersonii.AAC.1